MAHEIKSIITATGVKRFEVRVWSGSGEARVEFRRRFKLKTEATDFVEGELKDACNEKVKTRAEVDSPPVVNPMQINTFADEYAFWSKCKVPELSPSYRQNVKLFWKELEPLLGNRVIASIKPELIRTIEAGFREDGNARATVRKKIVWVKSVLNFSVESERIDYNPIAKFRTAKPLKTDPQFWDEEEASSFLGFARNKYPTGSKNEFTYLVYYTALNTALRAGELWALKPDCLRLKGNRMFVSEQFDLQSKCFRELKGKESRNVTLQPELAAELQGYIRRRRIGVSDVIFSTETRGPIDHNNFKNRFFAADLKEWGGKPIVFHGLRHTAATLMLSKTDIRTVQHVLGHKDLQTTTRYVHCLAENVSKASLAFHLAPAEPQKLKLSVVQLA